MSCLFTKIFVHLFVLAPVSNFNVYKLTERDPANIYLFKVNSRNTTKGVKRYEIYSKLTINTVEPGCSDIILNIFHIFILKSHIFT